MRSHPTAQLKPNRASEIALRARVAGAIREAWPPGAAGRVLLALLVLGLALRGFAMVSWWPTTVLEDSYQNFAGTKAFKDLLHPAGYGLILGALGLVTHQIVVDVVLQHLIGIVSALLLGAATRRITGSDWAGLVPAAVILLDADGIFLEHSIMSESWVILATSVGLYSAVRSLDQPDAWGPWPVLAGGALAVAVAHAALTCRSWLSCCWCW